jgi:hypothetical protein
MVLTRAVGASADDFAACDEVKNFLAQTGKPAQKRGKRPRGGA